MTINVYGHANDGSAGRQTVTVLTRLGLELTPANFHLVYLLLQGGRPELKQRFAALSRPVTQAALNELAREFLPFVFETPERVAGALAIADVVPKAQARLEDMRQALDEFSEQLATARSVAAALEENAAPPLAHVLTLLSQSAEVQSAMNADLLRSIAGWLADLEGGQAFAPQVPQTADASANEPITIRPTGGLGERAALMSRLQALHSGEQHLDGYSLMLCRVNGLDAYKGDLLGKARRFLIKVIGQQTGQMIEANDSACWMSSDELGLLLNSNSEQHLTDVSHKLRKTVDGAMQQALKTVKTLPQLVCRFGCATAHGSASPAQLYSGARLALQRAELTEDPGLIINSVMPQSSDRRYHAIYGRQYP